MTVSASYEIILHGEMVKLFCEQLFRTIYDVFIIQKLRGLSKIEWAFFLFVRSGICLITYLLCRRLFWVSADMSKRATLKQS